KVNSISWIKINTVSTRPRRSEDEVVPLKGKPIYTGIPLCLDIYRRRLAAGPYVYISRERSSHFEWRSCCGVGYIGSQSNPGLPLERIQLVAHSAKLPAENRGVVNGYGYGSDRRQSDYNRGNRRDNYAGLF